MGGAQPLAQRNGPAPGGISPALGIELYRTDSFDSTAGHVARVIAESVTGNFRSSTRAKAVGCKILKIFAVVMAVSSVVGTFFVGQNAWSNSKFVIATILALILIGWA